MKKALRKGGLLFYTGQLPTLPHTCACSTIGAERLNFRVRDGNGWVPLATVTQNLFDLNIDGLNTWKVAHCLARPCGRFVVCAVEFYGQAEWAISSGKLNVSPRLHIRPIKLVVFQCPS